MLLGAPSRAQSNFASCRPRLFYGCHIYLKGQFDKPYPSKGDLTNLLRNGGATILRREPDPENIPPEEKRVPHHVEPNSPLSKCSHFIIYQEGGKEPILKYDMEHCKSLPLAWLFECIKKSRFCVFCMRCRALAGTPPLCAPNRTHPTLPPTLPTIFLPSGG